MKREIELTVNGELTRVTIDDDMMLLEVLRGELGLTGTKKGCGEGECGACTVIMNGKAVNSCMIPAPRAAGAVIETVEGLAKNGEPSVLQQAFIDVGAVQCGFCTPGMLMSAKALLDENPTPTPQDVRRAISGNICRCTGYTKIEQAILAAAARQKGAC